MRSEEEERYISVEMMGWEGRGKDSCRLGYDKYMNFMRLRWRGEGESEVMQRRFASVALEEDEAERSRQFCAGEMSE
ncbi:hypothetical protein F2Q68_00019861 [Brassica cretica]|uniref:Uncharacterized protein n=1 Tax=Brassica cretica TaxID=69181 RepID=A0A8S9G1Q5_BRACR|nr:hypothetical protein F2Q68_00019861 [Brassica cretica]